MPNQPGQHGQDSLDTSNFPFQIKAGSGSPLSKVGLAGDVVTTSNSIVTVPIYDSQKLPGGVDKPAVTIVGFLQVFINKVDTTSGNINVTVMNVAGCSNDADKPAVYGTSPVPVRLITRTVSPPL